MPIFFDYQVIFTSGECGYAWNFNAEGFLCLAKPPGVAFGLTRVTDSQYGQDVYAIQAVSTGKYLVLAGGGPKILATADSPEKALLFRAEPTGGGSDPFLWEIASTGDYLHVSVDQDHLILADGVGTGQDYIDCQFAINAATVLSIVS